MEKEKKRRRRLGVLILLAAIMVWTGGCALGQPLSLSTLTSGGSWSHVNKGNSEQGTDSKDGTGTGSKNGSEVIVVGNDSSDGEVVNGLLAKNKPDADEGKKPVINHTDGDLDKTPPQKGQTDTDDKNPTATDKPGKPNKPEKPDKEAVKPGPGTTKKPDEVVKPSEKKKVVALTFDDGPDTRYTTAILDILKEKEVQATFFIVGQQVAKYPEIVKRIVDEGHVIGNHSNNHKDLSKLSKAQIMKEMTTTDELIKEAVGFVPTLFRAPYGAVSDILKNVLQANDRELIGWNVDTRDWAGTSIASMRQMIKEETKPGSTILMHSFGNKHIKNTVDMLPAVIEDLKDMGYSFVTSDKME